MSSEGKSRGASRSTSRNQVLQGTLDLIVLRTLASMGPQHAYGIAARLEQVSGELLKLNQGTLYPALVRLEQQGLDQRQMGQDGKRPGSEILRHHQSRIQGAGRGNRALASNVGPG